MKPKVFLAKQVPNEVISFLTEHTEVEVWKGESPIPRRELLNKIQEVEGLLLSGIKIDSQLLERAPHLKIVSNSSVGYNNFDIEKMAMHNVIGTHTPFVLDDTVADLAFGLILSAARRIPELDRFVKEGKWEEKLEDDLFGLDVHHKTIGIIGMGRVGEAIAKRAKLGFNMNVLYHNRNRKLDVETSLGAVYKKLNELLQEADFVVLMVPLTEETKHLIAEREFSLMKQSAFFINTSRGETIDEQALIKALENKEIRGAGLDVFEQEPIDQNHPFLKLDNVITLPHIGSATMQTRSQMAMVAAENLVAGVTGKIPKHVVPELRGLVNP
ncbi:2-hydroxyacid dehydrogenase [Metabacillus arenae]|uniref:D-glycerate dehydrogenase n=1 Tax=Metabacillus arenae TaxID=2771434 RepID=A0A926S1J7_9BACI|nr:D-glycerate dehydrogenase [Metabacillus arenae]MBD1381079.1 D-glycerate dehydrogenase [Metabacillus arenae]